MALEKGRVRELGRGAVVVSASLSATRASHQLRPPLFYELRIESALAAAGKRAPTSSLPCLEPLAMRPSTGSRSCSAPVQGPF